MNKNYNEEHFEILSRDNLENFWNHPSSEIYRQKGYPVLFEKFLKFPFHIFVQKSSDQKILGCFSVFILEEYPHELFFGFFQFQKFEGQGNSLSPNFDFAQLKMQTIALAKKYNKEKIIGPMDGNIWFTNRFKTQGFEYQYTFEPIGFPGLKLKLIEQGFLTDKKYVSHSIDLTPETIGLFEKSYEYSRGAGFEIIPMQQCLEESREDVIKACYELNIQGFQESHYYTPILYEDYRDFYFPILTRYDFRISFMLKNPQGRFVGYAYGLFVQDHLGPVGISKSITVLPEYQNHGLASALTYKQIQKTFELGATRAIAALIREGAKSEKIYQKLSHKKIETHEFEMFYYDCLGV